MKAVKFVQNAYDNVNNYDEYEISLIQKQINTLKEKMKQKKQVKRKRDQALYEDSVRSFMRELLKQPIEVQKEILASFAEEFAQDDAREAENAAKVAEISSEHESNDEIELQSSQNEPESDVKVDPELQNGLDKTDEAPKEPPKPKRGRKSKKNTETEAKSTEIEVKIAIPELKSDENSSESAKIEAQTVKFTLPDSLLDEDDEDSSFDESLDDEFSEDDDGSSEIKSQTFTTIKQTDGSEIPITPDVCEGDVVTDCGMCYITKKSPINDDEFRNIEVPILQDRISFTRPRADVCEWFLEVFGIERRDIPLTHLEVSALTQIQSFGSIGLKQSASLAFYPYGTDENGGRVEEDDPRIRHDLWVIAIESLRKKILKAFNGAIQIEYYIYREDLYNYDEFIPYEAVSARMRKVGPLDPIQEKSYQMLYESAKKSYRGA